MFQEAKDIRKFIEFTCLQMIDNALKCKIEIERLKKQHYHTGKQKHRI